MRRFNMTKKNIHVVGAVIVENKKILCAQRGPDKTLPLMWEFPGGKIEQGETAKEALIREIEEEMLSTTEVGEKVDHTVHEYDFGIVDLTTYISKITSGELKLTEHEQIKGLKPTEISNLKSLPADISGIEKLSKMTF